MNPAALSELQLDALREISSIGASHAATALSELVSRTIRISVPAIEVISVTEIASVFGGPEQIVGAVFAPLTGEIEGGVLFMVSPEGIQSIAQLLGAGPIPVEDLAKAKTAGVLVEAVRTLIDSYLQAVSEMTGLEAGASGVSWAYDMAGALFDAMAAETGMRADHAVLVRTAFLDTDRSVDAAFFFVPDPDSLAAILDRLGLL